MRADRTPAHDIHVSADMLASELIAIGCSGSPDRDPPSMVAIAVARCRARIDRAPWAGQSSAPPGWRPPARQSPSAVDTRRKAANDID
jgi:hypothetical protein